MNAVDIPELDSRGLRNFGLLMGGTVGALFGLVLPWLFDGAYRWWPWAVCAVFVGWGLLHPASLGLVYKWWMRFGLLLSKVTTPIIMGVCFYLVIFPVAVVFKVLRKDPMNRALTSDAETYRVASTPPDLANLNRPF